NDTIYQAARLQGALPKFAYGELAWLDKSLFPQELAKTLLDADYPYGQFSLQSFQSGITLHGKIPAQSQDGHISLRDVGLFRHDGLIKGAIVQLFSHATKPLEDIAQTLWLIGKSKEGIGKITYPYYQPPDAAKRLPHLLNGYLYGI